MGMYCGIRAVAQAEIEGLLEGSAAAPGHRRAGDPARSISLEKAWHGLHFLLTGSAWEGEPPLDFLLRGGEPIGEDDGYGPPRLLRPDEVRALDARLSHVSDDDLWSRFDPSLMEEEDIYPGVWDEPEDDLKEEYLGYFHALKRLVHEAGSRGMALVVMLN